MPRAWAAGLLAAVTLGGSLWGFASTRRWAKYEYEMQSPADDPEDAWQETEFAFTRLR